MPAHRETTARLRAVLRSAGRSATGQCHKCASSANPGAVTRRWVLVTAAIVMLRGLNNAISADRGLSLTPKLKLASSALGIVRSAGGPCRVDKLAQERQARCGAVKSRCFFRTSIRRCELRVYRIRMGIGQEWQFLIPTENQHAASRITR